MIDVAKYTSAMEKYKAVFYERWSSEKFKLEAIKCFQENWNIDADDFASMFDQATNNAGSLLTSFRRYPKGMILEFAKAAPEETREMFVSLFDETINLEQRINQFIEKSELIRTNHNNGSWKNHYQDANSISTYLWLRYPDKYFIFKYRSYSAIAKYFNNSDFCFGKGKVESVSSGYEMYDEIRNLISQDSELIEMYKEVQTDNCYQDSELRTLTFDFCFYVSNKILNSNDGSQVGSGLADGDVNTVQYWIYAPGDGACKWEEFYSRGVMGIGWHKVGDLSQYSSKEEMKVAMKKLIDPALPYKNAAHATWQFSNEMKPGDVVFVKKGRYSLIGRGIVTSDYLYDTKDPEYPNVRRVNWTHKGEWPHPGQAALKTLTNITALTDYVRKLNDLFDDGTESTEDSPNDEYFPEYSEEDFLNEVFMSESEYSTVTDLIKMKKNVILQGAPGVGKTFAAKRLAYSMMGEKNQDRVMMVQFHQSYTYEDFIEGFRPSTTSDGFEIKKGSFYNFCKKAADDLENEYFFIIDEINRGNLSKIFGELFMLIENDKRGNSLQLLYSDEKFCVPGNVYIIGMMNTADRSLALLDYALRRRFAFYEMKPGFSSDGFREYRIGLNNDKFNALIQTVESLNDVICNDDSLGEGFCIGHSYFCNIEEIADRTLSNIVEYEIAPLLKEYWYDDIAKSRDWIDRLRSAIK